MLVILNEICDHQYRIGVRGTIEATGFGTLRLANIDNWPEVTARPRFICMKKARAIVVDLLDRLNRVVIEDSFLA